MGTIVIQIRTRGLEIRGATFGPVALRNKGCWPPVQYAVSQCIAPALEKETYIQLLTFCSWFLTLWGTGTLGQSQKGLNAEGLSDKVNDMCFRTQGSDVQYWGIRIHNEGWGRHADKHLVTRSTRLETTNYAVRKSLGGHQMLCWSYENFCLKGRVTWRIVFWRPIRYFMYERWRLKKIYDVLLLIKLQSKFLLASLK